LQTPWAWRSSSTLLRRARLAACTVGVGLVLWLVYVELFRLDAICIYCTAVHILTFALFVTVALATVSTAEARQA
ncbi:MAG: vitamin K epoxide reductase family protein, partial [Acidimicrobiales bacterium]